MFTHSYHISHIMIRISHVPRAHVLSAPPLRPRFAASSQLLPLSSIYHGARDGLPPRAHLRPFFLLVPLANSPLARSATDLCAPGKLLMCA